MSVTATDARTYSSYEVCERVGLSYRMLDHWLRTGAIAIADDAHGSGSRRRFTEPEIGALETVVALYRSSMTVLRDFQNGTLWQIARAEQEMTDE